MSTVPFNFMEFATQIGDCSTPAQILNALDEALPEDLRLSVWGAMRFPLRWNNLDALVLNETVFLHESAPAGHWEAYLGSMRQHMSMPYAVLYALISPVTDSDLMRALEPIGIDRWPIDLARSYGVRDALHCPIGGKWGIHFWSKTVLSLTEGERILLYALASYTASRLEKVVPHTDKDWAGADHPLTPRERAVLRRLAVGDTLEQAAAHLGLSRETVRTHLKKAQARLGCRNRTHAVVQAVLLNLVP
jgi:DNA-binding CsgD family transcriptional regulator